MDFNKILFVRLSSIGDVLLTTPVIKTVRNKYPDAFLAYLVEDKSEEMVRSNPYLNEVIVFNKSEFKLIYKKHGIFQAFKYIWQFIKKLKKEEFDLVIDLHSIFRSGLMAFFTFASDKIGINKQLISIVYTSKTEPREDLHVVEENLNLLKLIGIKPEEFKREFLLSTNISDESNVKKLLKTNGLNNTKKNIILNPATSRKNKNWDEGNFALVGDWINNNLNANVILIGGPDDLKKCSRVINFMNSLAFNFAGKTTLKELVELLKKSDLLITGDTGTMHIAVAVNTLQIALFGPTKPKRFGAYSDKAVLIKSPDNDINNIEVDTVIKEIKRLLIK